ncbi:sterigmatocystin 8-O-methyltransferase precursor protein [Rutstroemia sp. NJR-2017a BBW]|nr:sterigmatocystin 8-O-methyltransferase precursor protein [Rutstroemia sp. NJR-2017a BBW]
MTPHIVKLPEYLSSISFQNPEEAPQNLFQYAMDTEMTYFDWLHTQPRDLEIFSATMQASTQRGQGLVSKLVSSQFPPAYIFSRQSTNSESKSTEDDSRADDILVVDVGGGRGKILNDLRTARLDLKGRMIVQDLPKEIDGREPFLGVETMTHDFFTPQPIHGKLFLLPYPLRSVAKYAGGGIREFVGH